MNESVTISLSRFNELLLGAERINNNFDVFLKNRNKTDAISIDQARYLLDDLASNIRSHLGYLKGKELNN